MGHKHLEPEDSRLGIRRGDGFRERLVRKVIVHGDLGAGIEYEKWLIGGIGYVCEVNAD